MSLRKIGRVLSGVISSTPESVISCTKKNWPSTAKSKKIPMPDAAVIASGLALIAGGASIALGVKPKFGAASVAGFLAAVTPSMHNFWKAADPNQRQNEMVHFGKNLALLSGALAFTDDKARRAEV